MQYQTYTISNISPATGKCNIKHTLNQITALQQALAYFEMLSHKQLHTYTTGHTNTQNNKYDLTYNKLMR